MTKIELTFKPDDMFLDRSKYRERLRKHKSGEFGSGSKNPDKVWFGRNDYGNTEIFFYVNERFTSFKNGKDMKVSIDLPKYIQDQLDELPELYAQLASTKKRIEEDMHKYENIVYYQSPQMVKENIKKFANELQCIRNND